MNTPDPQIEIILKTADFYSKETEKLLKKTKEETSPESKLNHLEQLMSLRSKIAFEINQIDKILKDEDPYDFGSMD